jgi:serine/threonine protein kinase
VAQKIAVDGDSAPLRLQRELDVARYLGAQRGGDLVSKCLGYNFSPGQPWILVTYRGRPLADLVPDRARWPLDHTLRTKLITDLLRALEILSVSSIVHGGISLDTLYWDGDTLQITDFSRAALAGTYPDGRPAHPGDDIEAVGRVIYQVYTGHPPPQDPAELRRQIGQVQDDWLRDLLLRRNQVTARDVNYVFADDPNRRPTAAELLSRLDTRPHGIQWEQMVAADQQVRAEFQRLRGRQRQFREHRVRAAHRLPWIPSVPPRLEDPPRLGERPGTGKAGRPLFIDTPTLDRVAGAPATIIVAAIIFLALLTLGVLTIAGVL